MRLKNIFNKQEAEKPKNDASSNKMDADVPKSVDEAKNEEMPGTESEPDDTPKSDEKDNAPVSDEKDDAPKSDEKNDAPMSDENDGAPVSDENPDLEETLDAEVDQSDEKLIALQNKAAELQDKYLRLAAEYDNYRKRTLREKTELIQTAGEALLKDILPVVDDFERGMEVAANAEDMDAVRVGMGLIYNKLKDFLTNNGVKEIDAMNEPFDTDWHEAITKIPAPSEDMKGMIVDVIQKGYVLHSKVIRYPKVVVGE